MFAKLRRFIRLSIQNKWRRFARHHAINRRKQIAEPCFILPFVSSEALPDRLYVRPIESHLLSLSLLSRQPFLILPNPPPQRELLCAVFMDPAFMVISFHSPVAPNAVANTWIGGISIVSAVCPDGGNGKYGGKDEVYDDGKANES